MLAWLGPWCVEVDDCECGSGEGGNGRLERRLVGDLLHSGHGDGGVNASVRNEFARSECRQDSRAPSRDLINI